MKFLFYSALITLLLSFPMCAFSQDLPIPAPENVMLNAQIPDPIPPEQDDAQNINEAQALIAFFKGLDEAVSAHSGNCQAMSDEISKYYDSHKKWIDSLDYAAKNIPQSDIDAIHQLAVDFGKKLAVCYDQKSIPEILQKYAGISGEF